MFFLTSLGKAYSVNYHVLKWCIDTIVHSFEQTLFISELDLLFRSNLFLFCKNKAFQTYSVYRLYGTEMVDLLKSVVLFEIGSSSFQNRGLRVQQA